MFEWQPFSRQALRSLDESTARLNIWEGAVRSSKSICSVVRWLEYLADGPPGPLLIFGKTERTVARNVLHTIREIVGKRDCVYNRGLAEARILGRVCWIVGANDERAEGKIRGGTLAGALGDELSLCPESFFQMLLSRLSVKGAKLFGTTNADGPYHWLKQGYLDREGLDLATWHFGLEDNLSLDPAYVENLRREYVGLWHKRFIDGLWVAAEGAVYDMFDEAAHVVSELPQIRRWFAGVDYGTTNPTVVLLVGEGIDDRLYVAAEDRYDPAERGGRQRTDGEHSQQLAAFLGDLVPSWIWIDPSAASFRLQVYRDHPSLRRALAPADNDVLDGIRRVSTLLSQGRLLIHSSCAGLVREMSGYVWDAGAQAKGDDAPVKGHDHGPDALRYVINGTRFIWSRWGVGIA